MTYLQERVICRRGWGIGKIQLGENACAKQRVSVSDVYLSNYIEEVGGNVGKNSVGTQCMC